MEQLFLSRMPIFGRDGQVWGYEVCSRQTEDGACEGLAPESMPTSLASLFKSPDNGFSSAYCLMRTDEHVLVTEKSGWLDNEKVILSVDAAQDENGSTSGIDELRKQGARLSLSIGKHAALHDRDLSGFDLVTFPFELIRESMQWSWLENRTSDGTKVLINSIETHTELEFAKAVGADLFQGNFFKRPVNFLQERLPTVMVNRFKLLQLLEGNQDRSNDLIKAIEADVSISLRLFRFINSPHFSLTRTVDSVRQCVQLLGWGQLKIWIRMLLVMEFCPAGKTRELAYSSALRARFLELLALYSGKAALTDNLFLLGLFSLLEAMLERPYQCLLKDFSMNTDVEKALLGLGGPLLPWLELVEVLDDGNWLRIDAAAMNLGLDLRCVSRAKLDALTWTNEFWSLAR